MNGVHRQTLNAKNFSEAFKITSQRWFPCSAGTLNRVRERLVTGYYHENRKELLRDLKSDAALFLFSLRKLRKMIVVSASGNLPAIDGDEPMEMFIDSVREVVADLTKKEIYHSYSQVTDAQAGRLKEMVLSSALTDSLAEKLTIDKNVGFTCSLLRQLGLTLIAWNYPNIYRQALQLLATESSSSTSTIDSVLHSQLGFSPAMLGVRYAEISGLPDAIVRELDTEQPHRVGWDKLGEYANEGRPGVVSYLCAVGEAFARANSPQYYPTVRDDLELADRSIRQLLGPEGSQIIVERTKMIYGDVIKAVLGSDLVLVDQSQLPQSNGDRASGNVFLSAAPEALRTRIQTLYEKIDPEKIDESLIRELVHQVIPQMGFNTVVVYTADPTNSSLNPVLRLGRPLFNEPRPVNLISIINDTNPVRRAFSSGLLVYESGFLLSGEKRSFVASIIGSKVRVGVLYLETGSGGIEDYRTDVVHAAKLLSSCLADFLHLN